MLTPSSEKPEENLPSNEATPFEKLLNSSDIQKAIAEIPSLIRENIQTKSSLARTQIDAQVSIAKGISTRTLIATCFIALAVIGAVLALAYWNKLSSDAVSIVLGTVIGSAFTFLSRAYFRNGS